MMRFRRASIAMFASLLAACGGGGSAPAVVPPPSAAIVPVATPSPAPTPASGARGSASLTITIPQKQAAAGTRRPQYITSFVQALDITVLAPNGQQSSYSFFPLTPQSTYCSNAGGPLVCTVNAAAPPGVDSFLVVTYDSASFLQAFAISAAMFTQTISATAPNVLNVVTNPVPSYTTTITSPSNGGTIHVPTGGSVAVTFAFADADSQVFTGPFDGPISLALAGSTHYALSTTSMSASTTTVMLTNDGTTGSAGLTLTLNPTTVPQQFAACCPGFFFTAITP